MPLGSAICACVYTCHYPLTDVPPVAHTEGLSAGFPTLQAFMKPVSWRPIS